MMEEAISIVHKSTYGYDLTEYEKERVKLLAKDLETEQLQALLVEAILRKEPEIVKYIVKDLCLDINFTDVLTSVCHGVCKDVFEMIKLLVSLGADVNFLGNDENSHGYLKTPLGVYLEYNEEYALYLIARGADPNHKQYVSIAGKERLYTYPLQMAVVKNYDRAIKALLKVGADINLKGTDYYGMTSYELAVGYKLEKCKAVLDNWIQDV